MHHPAQPATAPGKAEQNRVPAREGQVAAICRFCGLQAPPTPPNSCGEPDLWLMPQGWSEAPYPVDYHHRDGSAGSLYSCPACNSHLATGQSLRRRAYQRQSVSEAPQ